MALTVDDIDENLIASARAARFRYTPFARFDAVRPCRKAAAAVAGGTRVVLDLDFRPVLWGLRPLGDGATRYVESDAVTATLCEFLPLCDVIVGTEEEFAIAGGSAQVDEAIDKVRHATSATLVVKRGADGCTVHSSVDGHAAPALALRGAPIEVFNILGAGDAFMAGFLSGWLRDRSLAECVARANACGALVVSRHACAPAMPTPAELAHWFSQRRSATVAADATLNRLHRAGTRGRCRRCWRCCL
jgi:5-dehydro-2-deoxygluconokinase